MDTDVVTSNHGAHRNMLVGMAGTFDIENYGDLLFPLIAAEALQRRDPRIRVVPYALNGKSDPSWPFQVRPLEQLPASVSRLSAMLIGGGQIVRFDKAYPVSVPTHVDVPIAYWLVPAVLAATAGTPVIWNAVGVWTGSPRAPWNDDLLCQVFAASHFIGVRDRASRDHLANLAPNAAIELVPDTAFGVSRLWPLGAESAEFTAWRTALGMASKYVVIQASAAVATHRFRIQALVKSMGSMNAVILPVSWCHGDRAETFPELEGRVFRSRTWLGPDLIREIVARSEFVFASSLHVCITALSYGVPGARAPSFMDRKHELLDEFQSIVHIDNREALWRLVNRGRWVEPRASDYADRLDRHWDNVANVVLQPPIEQCDSARSLMLAWVAKQCGKQGAFESTGRLIMSTRESLARYLPNKRVALRRRLYFLRNLVVEPAWWQDLIGKLPGTGLKPAPELAPRTTSGTVTVSLARGTERILNLDRIAQHRIAATPYQWAFINGLFSLEDGAQLAASFPHDKLKRVKGYDGEKGYEYRSRSLIHMGATVPSHPESLSPAWRALVRDLLSDEYRRAIGRITGRDLSSTVMEVNLIHYGPGAFMGPHRDLAEKLVTHVLYFNEAWNPDDGGCLEVLNSSNPSDVAATILPLVGNSALVVRSDQSWHSVSRVTKSCRTSRRSINVIFHLPGSVSTMWPPGENPALRDYAPDP